MAAVKHTVPAVQHFVPAVKHIVPAVQHFVLVEHQIVHHTVHYFAHYLVHYVVGLHPRAGFEVGPMNHLPWWPCCGVWRLWGIAFLWSHLEHCIIVMMISFY